jgi:ribosome-associated protein
LGQSPKRVFAAQAQHKGVKEMEVIINPPFIKLEQFLKFAGAVQTGGEAKNFILDGEVKVDGEVCLMRGKKLRGGEIVEFNTESFKCVLRV